MCMITWCVNCCAKCQFHPFLPFSSITMPPSWKMLLVAKTPENSTFPLFHMKMRYLSHDYASQSYSTIIEQNFSNCINRINTVHTRVRVTHYMIFGKHHLHLPVNTIYSTIHIIPISISNILHKISYSIQLYRYYNTVIIL